MRGHTGGRDVFPDEKCTPACGAQQKFQVHVSWIVASKAHEASLAEARLAEAHLAEGRLAEARLAEGPPGCPSDRPSSRFALLSGLVSGPVHPRYQSKPGFENLRKRLKND